MALMALAAHAAPPFTKPPITSELLPEEDRVWVMSRDLEKSIRRRGAVLENAALTAYMQRIMDRLYPEFEGTIRVRAIDDPNVNAFCMASGQVFVHLGLLAHMSNESQLATVLAHEGAHFVHRHSYQNMQSAQSGSGFAVGATILLGPLGALLGGLTGASSIAGFSRDLEREADRVGFERMAVAGYDYRESIRAFEVLAAAAKIEDKSPPYLFASHPRLVERIESYQELIQQKSPPSAAHKDDSAFQDSVAPLREAWLKRELGMGRHKHVVHWLTQPDAEKHWPEHAGFYLGEAYRLRAGEGDEQRAEEAYRTAISRAPSFAPSHRMLGIALHKRGNDEGITHLRKYLELDPRSTNAKFIEQLISQKS